MYTDFSLRRKYTSRYGIREICDVTFKALTSVDIGNQHFDAGQPVLVLDTAKTSSLEGASTTVYAQGGKGNPRLIGWDGEKTLTFTVEDALISAESFAMLSGAGVVKGRDAAGNDAGQKIYMHTVYDVLVEGKTTGTGNDATTTLYARLPQEVRDDAQLVVSKEAPVYAISLDNAGAPKTFLSAIKPDEIFYADVSGTTETLTAVNIKTTGEVGCTESNAWAKLGAKDVLFKLATDPSGTNYTETINGAVKAGDTVKIDCYTVHGAGATELQIDAKSFAGYYYIEADTLFREETTGRDFPAQFIIPRGKIQSNFTFTMANSGDPSTFTFTIDCFPAYTKFNKTKKVMAALQVLDPTDAKHNYSDKTIIGHAGRPYQTNTTGDPDKDIEEAYAASIWNSVNP